MKRFVSMFFAFAFFVSLASCELFIADDSAPSGQEPSGQDENEDEGEGQPLSASEIADLKTSVWNEYVSSGRSDSTRKSEFANKKISMNGFTMKYGQKILGSIDGNPFPVYIALHGGGSSTSGNNQQFDAMADYYSTYSVTRGIYIYPRAIEDTWDCHWRPTSFAMYDRIIENLKLFEQELGTKIDMNKVYLMGYSAGGDGVYRISPVMADRFAAVNMSAGHPNGVSFLNMRNLPILLQVGQVDTSYDRHKWVPKYNKILNEYASQYGGYVHDAFIHVGKPHNFNDYYPEGYELQSVIADPQAWLDSGCPSSNSVASKKVEASAGVWVSKYDRNPLPEKIVWNMKPGDSRFDSRSVKSFYWLSAEYSVKEGVIVASYSKSNNTVTIESNTLDGDACVLLNEKMVDFSKKITFKTPNGTYEVSPKVDEAVLRETTSERGDPDYQFLMKVKLSELK